ncbi:hypothetical protein [Stella sp.]|uniref:hypothetical protein n=1 Tax=Stella sp. TaxID=2912054 RepID=UPI0035ADE0EE
MTDETTLPHDAALAVARWARLPCDAARARRLHRLLVAQKVRMARIYAEDVSGLEFDFLAPREG